MNLLPHELIIDNFAGGGGTSTGLEWGFGRPVDVAINHDPKALAMHRINHPETTHYCESVWDVDPIEASGNQPVGLVWLSPDCRHFSKLKGGKPVQKKIRGLAWIALRWASKTRPRVIMLENVSEFQTWGDLKADGTPCPKSAGRTFNCFVNALRYQGYQVDWRELRACDYGAPTIRNRFFLIARRDGLPIKWPQITHGDPKSKEVKSGRLLPWRTAADCINLEHDAKSIFGRNRSLAESTMYRIVSGITRYVINNPEPHFMGLTAPVLTECANGSSRRSMPIDEPLRTICAQTKGGHHAIMIPKLEIVQHAMTPDQLNQCKVVQLFKSHLEYLQAEFKNSPMIDLLKQFVQTGVLNIGGILYRITDILFRMLQPDELYKAQGFEGDYNFNQGVDENNEVIALSKNDACRMVGNSVCPQVSKALVVANFSHEKQISRVA